MTIYIHIYTYTLPLFTKNCLHRNNKYPSQTEFGFQIPFLTKEPELLKNFLDFKLGQKIEPRTCCQTRQ